MKPVKKYVKTENSFGEGIESLFSMFTKCVMSPRVYKKKELPSTVTVTLSSENMDMLHTISCRLGTKRSVIASHIINLGIYQAASGCGFEIDEEGKIPEDQKKWDLTQHKQGIQNFEGEDE